MTTTAPKRRVRPKCYSCQMLEVPYAGELCRVCIAGGPEPKRNGPKGQGLEDWDLAKLIATQDSGDVPGSDKWKRHEEAYDEANERYTIY